MSRKKINPMPRKDASQSNDIWDSAIEQEKVAYALHPSVGRLDINLLSQKIAVEVTFSLAERIEELNVMSNKFRSGLQKTIAFSLNALFSRKERCLVVPDAVPGFTMMAFKKTQALLSSGVMPVRGEPKLAGSVPSEKSENAEAMALLQITESFYQKENGKILVIDCPDAIFALFPVKQLVENLKMLGYYHVD